MIEVIPAIKNDAIVIQSLAQEIWPIAYNNILSKEQIDFMLNDMYSVESILNQMEDNHHYLLVVDDEEFVGFSSFSEMQEPKCYKIHKLYLHPKIQGKGVGKLVISTIANQALDNEIATLELNVNRNNPALDFYLKQGFEVSEEVDIPYYEFTLNDYVLRKSLIQP